MTHFIEVASVGLVAGLAISAARSFLLAGIAFAAIAIFGVRSTSHRLFVWTSVLYASLALPLLGWLVPALQITLPEFIGARMQPAASSDMGSMRPHAPATTASTTSRSEIRFSGTDAQIAVSTKRSNRPVPIRAHSSSTLTGTAVPWTLVSAAVYLSGMAFLFLRFVVGMLLSRRLVRKTKAVSELELAEKLESHEASARLRIAMSERISVPLTVGVCRPTILLPADWREWDRAKLRAVLAHEGSHVTRRDSLTHSLSLLYRAFFWVSPLAWWLHRQLGTLAEQASDEAALWSGADQRHYARTLLGFFETLQTSPSRVRWQGVSMARAGQAEQRLERILDWKGTVTMSVKRSVAVTTVALAVPVVVIVAAVRPVTQASAAVKPAVYHQAAPAAPAAAPAGGVSGLAPVAGVRSVGVGPAIAPVAPAALITPTAPMAPIAPQNSGKFSYSYGYDDDERFVIVSGKSDSYTMSGSTQDVRHVEKLKKQIPGDFIWFQRDEESYIIRDQATIDRARKLFAPQEELGKKQEELGKQQEALGKQQEELGKKMEQVRINVPDMTAELDRLKAKLEKLGPTATMEQIGDLQSEIGELQSKIGDLQGRAGEEQGRLGELQGELGEKQGKLGEQQGELGRQQGELAEKAAREMKEILDEAIKNGTAKPEQETVKSPSL